MNKKIKLIFKYDRNKIKAEPIHKNLLKMEFGYDSGRVFCLMDHIIWVLNFESPTLIEAEIPCVYVNDFSVSKDLVVVASTSQSGNEVLKMLSLEKFTHYNWLGEPERGDFIWVSKSRFGNGIEGVKIVDGFDHDSFEYVKFLHERNQFIAFSNNVLYKVGQDGSIISCVCITDVNLLYYRNNKIIDITDVNVFVSQGNCLKIYNLDSLNLEKQINFPKSIYIVKALEDNNAIIILNDGSIYLCENYVQNYITKIDREIVAFAFDNINHIYYFGNSSGEIFAFDKNLNIIFEEIVDDSIRDILVLNEGKNILFGGKNINFYLFENEDGQFGENDEILFWKDKGDGMKKIFLSYSHKDSDLADFIDTILLNNGIKLMRDVRDIRYRQSIKDFMKKIRKTDYVFLIISQEYLQSSACMYEMLELIKDENYQERIIPIIRSDANIFDVNGKGAYVKYWQNQYKEIETESKEIDILNREFYINELRKIESIQRNLPEFLELVSDMNLIICKDKLLFDNEIQLIISIIKS